MKVVAPQELELYEVKEITLENCSRNWTQHGEEECCEESAFLFIFSFCLLFHRVAAEDDAKGRP